MNQLVPGPPPRDCSRCLSSTGPLPYGAALLTVALTYKYLRLFILSLSLAQLSLSLSHTHLISYFLFPVRETKSIGRELCKHQKAAIQQTIKDESERESPWDGTTARGGGSLSLVLTQLPYQCTYETKERGPLRRAICHLPSSNWDPPGTYRFFPASRSAPLSDPLQRPTPSPPPPIAYAIDTRRVRGSLPRIRT